SAVMLHCRPCRPRSARRSRGAGDGALGPTAVRPRGSRSARYRGTRRGREGGERAGSGGGSTTPHSGAERGPQGASTWEGAGGDAFGGRLVSLAPLPRLWGVGGGDVHRRH